MPEESTYWIDMYQQRIDKLKRVYLEKQSPSIRGRILSALQRITSLSERLPDNEGLFDILNELNPLYETPEDSRTLEESDGGVVRENFQEILKRLRSDNGVSHTKLASTLGCTTRTVSRWESGDSKPRGLYLKRLAEVFNVPVRTFYQ
ncbi:MAG: helix-turn-helix transcriptional regulator [Candidatus Woesearchaeota archaeon]